MRTPSPGIWRDIIKQQLRRKSEQMGQKPCSSHSNASAWYTADNASWTYIQKPLSVTKEKMGISVCVPLYKI